MATIEDQTRRPHPLTGRLFEPFQLNKLMLENRIVMPAMGFHVADGGVPGSDVADYYARRAEGGVGLMFTEGVYIDHPVAGSNPLLMRFCGEEPLKGWGEVVRRVHRAGGRIMPELWHVGLIYKTEDVLKGNTPTYDPTEGKIGPSGYIMPDRQVTEPMTVREIEEVVDAFARGAEKAKELGFDGVELLGAHGYLIDQFFWDAFNRRTDEYGGSIRKRSRFAAQIIREIRRRVGPDFPVIIRISQFKLQDYNAKIARNPSELEEWIAPLIEAGVDAFDCSQRRFWQPEFPDSDLNLAGWVKKISGMPTITVGSVGLDVDMLASLGSAEVPTPQSIDRLLEMLDRQDFDLVAIGRSLISDPDWAHKVRAGRMDALIPFTPAIFSQSPSHEVYSGT